jgi:hypothetical protein
VGVRGEFRDHQSNAARPTAPELSRRNREAGLNQTIKFYESRPDPMPDGVPGAWVERLPVPKLVLVSDGAVFEVVLTEVTP